MIEVFTLGNGSSEKGLCWIDSHPIEFRGDGARWARFQIILESQEYLNGRDSSKRPYFPSVSL